MSAILNTIDGVDYIFSTDAAGKTVCQPVDLEKFEQYIAGIKAQGPDAVAAKLSDVADYAATGEMRNAAWQALVEKQQDVVRRNRAAEIEAEINAKPLGCY